MAREKSREQVLIFLVDADADRCAELGAGLKEQDDTFSLVSLGGPEEALEALPRQAPDAIICAGSFPGGMSGPDLLRRTREAGFSTPFVCVTDPGDEEAVDEALRLGAEDCFVRGMEPAQFVRVARAVRRAIGRHGDLMEHDRLLARYELAERVRERIMEEANDCIMLLDDEGRVTDANRTCLAESGYRASELLWKPLSELIVEEERSRFEESLEALLLTGTPLRALFPFLRKNGQRRELELSASVVPVSPGQRRVLLICRDVSEWLAREQALKEERQLFGETLEALEEGVHVVDRELQVIYCNNKVEKICRGKVSCREMMGRDLVATCPLAEEGARELYRKVFEDGVPSVREVVHDLDGERVVTVTSRIPLMDGLGRVSRALTVIREVTAEHALQEEKDRLLRAVEESVVGIAITDKTDRYRYVNRRHAQIHGFADQKELVGLSLADITEPSFLKERGGEIIEAISRVGQWIGESRAVKRDGTEVPVFLSVNAVHDEQGGYQGRICIVQDLSREKRMARELLEKQRELEALSRELDSFVSMTSHELRSPLTNIEGFARLLEERLETLSSEEVSEFSGRILSNAIRLHRLIDDLLLFAREKKRQVECQDVDVKGLLGDVLGQLAKLVEEAGPEISVDLRRETVRADRQKLFQVLKNLVENALVYRAEDKQARIGIECREEEPGWVLFRVRDNGPGIAEAEQETIFEIFRRGSTSRGRQGTGVGLALVRQNVTSMGGDVSVESAEGEGATFSFRLPAGC